MKSVRMVSIGFLNLLSACFADVAPTLLHPAARAITDGAVPEISNSVQRTACGAPLASMGSVLNTHLNPPTVSWQPCWPQDSTFAVFVDNANSPAITTGTTFTPPSEMTVGAHAITILEMRGPSSWSAPLTIQVNIMPQAVTHTSQFDPNDPGATYSYPSSNGHVIAAAQLELAEPTGFRDTDVMQGNVSDCYFVASLAAIAMANPNWLTHTIIPATDGYGEPLVDPNGYPLYLIRMFYPDDNHDANHLTWTYLTDAQIPSNGARVVWDANVNPPMAKIGMPLLEKGFAALDQVTNFLQLADDSNYYLSNGGYQTITQGGWAHFSYEALAGGSGVEISPQTAAATLANIQPDAGTAVVASTDNLAFQSPTQLPSGATIAKTDTGEYAYQPADGSPTIVLINNHAYSLVQSNAGLFQWRNPWGSTSGAQGIFSLPPEDLSSIFCCVEVLQLP